jgi:hypothetical protein
LITGMTRLEGSKKMREDKPISLSLAAIAITISMVPNLTTMVTKDPYMEDSLPTKKKIVSFVVLRPALSA